VTLTLADRLDIHDLYARYAHFVDGEDDAAWAECFSAEGVLSIPAHRFRAEGRAALQRFAANYRKATGGLDRHIMSNILIACPEDGTDSAAGSCYLQVIVGGSGQRPPTIKTTGTYRDRLPRTGRRWRFVSRELSVDGA
jgi:hypothetical protein